jgi:CDP-paratose 2-epimerase
MANQKVLVIGGAGFIGINAVHHFLQKGDEVIIFDNFSRGGSQKNIDWIQSLFPNSDRLHLVQGDIRYDQAALDQAVKDVDVVLHLAAQVAVTTSVLNPREDFEINALGTFNVLEAIRLSGNNPILIYASTNKVYGGLEDVKVLEKETRYEFETLVNGVNENQPLDFHSPYGCSKGTADQYVRDYHRMYGLRTIVFRQSCIYGQHQFGIEDQGWVAWFMIALSQNKPMSIYGNGKQVRDLLYVEDLVNAYDLAIQHIDTTKGQIYNIGGGPTNTMSVWYEFRPILEELFHRQITANSAAERPGDQPIFIADVRKAERDFGWSPTVTVDQGTKKLFQWITENPQLFTS